jgi:hypothetical protein
MLLPHTFSGGQQQQQQQASSITITCSNNPLPLSMHIILQPTLTSLDSRPKNLTLTSLARTPAFRG